MLYRTNFRTIILTFLLLLMLLLPAALQAQANRVEEALRPFVERGEIPGFLSLLAAGDEILRVDAAGFRDTETKQPINQDSMFWIASITKTFTAAGAMLLVDEGKIDLDAPLEQYLPEFASIKVAEPNDNGVICLRPPKSRPTVRQALGHRAGWEWCSPMMSRFGLDSMPMAMTAFHIAQTPLSADPGEKFLYSQLGIDAVGAVIEKVSGVPYTEFVRQRFFEPLGMTRTTFWPTAEDQKGNWIKSYTPRDGRFEEIKLLLTVYPLEDRFVRFPEPGGGMFTTANDLLKFFQMLACGGEYRGKRLLSEAAVAEMTKNSTPENPDSGYGLGTFLGGEWFGHFGAYGPAAMAAHDGRVRLLVIQVSGSPKIEEVHRAWELAAFDVYEALWQKPSSP